MRRNFEASDASVAFNPFFFSQSSGIPSLSVSAGAGNDFNAGHAFTVNSYAVTVRITSLHINNISGSVFYIIDNSFIQCISFKTGTSRSQYGFISFFCSLYRSSAMQHVAYQSQYFFYLLLYHHYPYTIPSQLFFETSFASST